jgi:hypothetical protein
VLAAWILFLLSQTALVANGQLDHHRAWGLVGISLATAMVVIGLAAAINTLTIALAAGYGDSARAFFILPVSAISLFAGFIVALAAGAPPPGTARQNHLGVHQPSRGSLDFKIANPSSMAKRTLRRQSPEVGAVCLNGARTVLCGGRAVMRVPTAIPIMPRGCAPPCNFTVAAC